MNVLLLVILALSGLLEALAGIWAIALPANFAGRWLRIPQQVTSSEVAGAMALPLFLLGLATLGLAALHCVAIYWLRSERRDAYRLSIILGVVLLIAGLSTYLHGLLGGPKGFGPTNLLLADALRGALLGVFGLLASRAPATVRELRLPERRDRMRISRPDSMRDRRSLAEREGRGRDRGRGRGRPADRRGEGRRSSDSGRRGGVGRPQAQRPERGSDRESPVRPAPSARVDTVPGAQRVSHGDASRGPEDLRARPLTPREGTGPESRDRWQQRRHVAPPADGEGVRSLGVVVTGRPPVAGGPRQEAGPRGERTEPTGATEERGSFPRAPMVPRVRVETLRSRPLSHDLGTEDGGERAGGPADRRHRRRRRPTTRQEQDHPSLRGAGPRSREEVDSSPEEPDRDGSMPPVDSYAEAADDTRWDAPVSRGAETRHEPAQRMDEGTYRESAQVEPVTEEPIDMLSVFSGSDEAAATPGSRSATEFGRHRRPFTTHRKNKQVKPRGAKVHQQLGGDAPKDREPQAPPPADDTSTGPTTGRARMTNGIGPIDLTEPDPGESDGGET